MDSTECQVFYELKPKNRPKIEKEELVSWLDENFGNIKIEKGPSGNMRIANSIVDNLYTIYQ